MQSIRAGVMVNIKSFVVGTLNVCGNLSTKSSRTTWENAFMATYLNPVLSVSFSLYKFMHFTVMKFFFTV